ncbi:AMP-binding protein [Ensifer sp. LCM 4579]|uniref:AMP-binding protein n=1 Tax=Ensifer sp. LCM 4579 TaxID=1848292 RepID=UPI0008DA1F5F|nr:AMP-binding protein [Ensifer sp. LCM 4579]OHV78720.1 acyl-phosphate glycerol 3-phosphate acyltransferase [Ensifer sp. LCM 4579]
MSKETGQPSSPAAVDGQDSHARDLIAIVTEFVRELHSQRADAIEIAPSSRIERDLGIDSLGRTELTLRIERAFQVRLPANAMSEAETVSDLGRALGRARPAGKRAVIRKSTASALPTVPAASEARTLVEALEWHEKRHGDRLHLTLLEDETTTLDTLSYGELAARARRVAAAIVLRGVAPGDRVALMLPTSADFFVAFFGILYAGAVPVPIYPPTRLSQLEEHVRRQAGILGNAGARLLITVPEGRRLAGLLKAVVEPLKAVDCVVDRESAASERELPGPADPGATALIQYTSGSTGDPKGVVLSHANLLANIRAMGEAMQAGSKDVFVSWLPLYHDMGLIGAWLGCLYYGAPLYAMSPLNFLTRPESWLWAMHNYRATLSASPNFGFEICLNKLSDPLLEGLDLSSVRMIANGAEPVSAATLRRFSERFGRFGLSARALAPVYGLAESSVGLAFPPLGRPPLIDRVNRRALSTHGIAEIASAEDSAPVEIVACGQPLPRHEIRIVDDAGRELGERREGQLQFRGPSATAGYFRDEEKTRALFHDDWLDSGDRAYMAGGDVFITGRVKDIIIRAGRHLYPQEIEAAVAAVPGVRKGGVAVFGQADRTTGTERVVVIAETAETDPDASASMQERVIAATTDIVGSPADEVVLVPPRSVPKTSSGKIRRSAAKVLYESGRIGSENRPLPLQLSSLMMLGIGAQMRRLARRLKEFLFAVWWWAVLGVALSAGAVAVLVLPRLSWRWHAVRWICRAALAIMGVPLAASGVERVPRQGAMLAFNHSSYFDAFVLAAILPGEPAIVAKRELAGHLLAGPLLRRLQIPFVERYDVSESLEDASRLASLARKGRVLVVFPEGTFTRRPGLTGFYLGAFKVAAAAGLAILPGIIRGTRTVLRGEQWFPRHGAISVEIADAVAPSGTSFEAVLQLRDAVRGAILSRCGEPDLGGLAKPEPRA